MGSEVVPVMVEMADGAWQDEADTVTGARQTLEHLCRELAVNPRLGTDGPLPSLYHLRISAAEGGRGPLLEVAYAYGPPTLPEGTVRINAVRPVERPVAFDYEVPGIALPEVPEPPQSPLVRDPAMEAIAARQVTEAWQRMAGWLAEHAPGSYRTLLPGAGEEEIGRAEEAFGVELREDLKALWRLCAGVRDEPGAGFLAENRSLLPIGESVRVQQRQLGFADEELWRPEWIPVCSFNTHDTTCGLYMDMGTGHLYAWTRFGECRPEHDSLTTYLEEIADALEVPLLAGPAKPGLLRGALMWGPTGDPDDGWEPFTG
ncbi:SMI1/KNR4 family protein [Streptomyces broussonetiae]|nr:SMI1/KNR4 family protein [Streptomyces broussonetiae]